MNHGYEILLDMDGVLANFCKAAHIAHGKKYEPELITQFNMAKLWGIAPAEFWSPLGGAEFWASFEPYPWAKDLLNCLQELGPVTICTAPSRDPHCTAGKLEWLTEHLGIGIPHVIFANKKHFLAKPNHILVDDSPKKVAAFREAGGHGVMFPQPWNEGRDMAGANAWVIAVAHVSQILD